MKCIPLTVVAVAEHSGFEVYVKWIVGRGVIGGETVSEECLFGHCKLSVVNPTNISTISTHVNCEASRIKARSLL